MAWSLGTGLLRSTSNTNKTDSLLFRGGGWRERDQSNNSDSIYMTPSEVNECDTGHGHLHGRVGSFVWGGDGPTRLQLIDIFVLLLLLFTEKVGLQGCLQ